MIMICLRYLWLVSLLLLPVYSHASGSGKDLQVVVINPPIPPSEYTTSYRENAAGQIQHRIMVKGLKRGYQIYVPQKPADGPRPAIVLLHGAKRSGVSVVEQWKYIADIYNIILIGPHGINGVWSMENDGTNFLNAIIRDAKSKYQIDPKRLYLFGHSAGGRLALYMSIENSNLFAAYGHNSVLYVLEGHNHWYYDIAPFINDYAWRFLRQYQLN